jgi:hypothetical protein
MKKGSTSPKSVRSKMNKNTKTSHDHLQAFVDARIKIPTGKVKTKYQVEVSNKLGDFER